MPTDFQYPLLNIIITMMWFFLFFLWIWIAITVLVDVFRSHDMGGFAKALWLLFIVLVPFLGVLVYLLARGHKMQEHQVAAAKASQDQFSAYVKETAGSSESSAEQLTKLAALHDSGKLTDAEFDAQKAKILS